MKPIIKIRGNRILVTPSADIELSEAERRVFVFANPSVRTFERLVEAHSVAVDGETKIVISDLTRALLRDWKNVVTDDVDTATKYGLGIPEGGIGDGVVVPHPADLEDVLPLAELREVVRAAYDTISPSPSGN